MAKPDRHPWPYGPQWNYYPPMINFSKIPFPNGPQVHVDSNDNYLSIRCPEPRRPYHVPYPSFKPYCHQDNYPVRSYLQTNSVYTTPKQYVYRPLSQENINSSYKVTEHHQSYPACSNYSFTKDQTTCYQTTWNNTSHFQRNPPELDVRHFLATWQDKDDDFVDVSTDNEQAQVYQGNDSIPLDCSKRNSNDKNIRKSYNDNFLNGQTLNTTGYIVQPYYLKDDAMSFNRPGLSEELNNNVLHRNNLNYESIHQGYTKHFYPNTVKFPTSKFLSCEHNLSYSQPLNNCDISSNQLRSTLNQPRQKDILMDSSERSQYNLSSSLESGELFCDINPRNEEIPKAPIIHPIFNDSMQKINSNEQCYFGNENSEFSDNLMLNDFHSLKDSWDMFSTNLKVKDGTKVSNNSKFINKVSPQNHYQQLLPNSNNNSINISSNASSIAYEGAFNILSNVAVNSSDSIQLNGTNCVEQSHDLVKPVVSSNSIVSTKLPLNVTKTLQANTKIRPYQFNEEISSDDIDISIASSGDFIIEDHSSICCTSVISFSKTKKEKLNSALQKNVKINDIQKNNGTYPCPVFNNDTEINCSLSKDDHKKKLNEFPEDINEETEELLKKNSDSEKNSIVNNMLTIKGDAIDLSVLKSQNPEETASQTDKDPMCYLDLPNNYFENNNFKTTEQKTATEFSDHLQTRNSLPDITSEKCEDSDPKEVDINMNNEKLNNDNFVHDSSFLMFEDPSPTDKYGSSSPTDNFGSSSPRDNFRSSPLTDNFRSSSTENFRSRSLSPIESSRSSSPLDNNLIPNDNLLLLAHCSQEYGCEIRKKKSQDSSSTKNNKICNENQSKSVRDSVIKCSLRWDRIFNIMSNDGNLQPDMSLDLGPAKVELRMPTDNCSSNHWKIVEADNKIPTSSIVQVKRLILKRKNQSEERIPKMIIKKTEGQEYRSYLKKESSKAVLNCEQLKIYCDKMSKSP